MHWFKFRGGPNDGVVAIATREIRGDVDLRGQQLVDQAGSVVGRVVRADEVPAALRAPALTTEAGAPASNGHKAAMWVPPAPPPAKKATAQGKPAEGPRFATKADMNRAVRAWCQQRGHPIAPRGAIPRDVLQTYAHHHGDPVIGQ